MATKKKSYNIDALLATGRQLFSDWSADERKSWQKSIAKDGLASPINITSDGTETLITGRQRLMALKAAGRVNIDGNDVHITPGATEDNLLEFIIKLDVQRRHLSVAEKVAIALTLQKESGWSLQRIADSFGVSRPAVSQWMTGLSSSERAAVVIGKDGVMRDVTAQAGRAKSDIIPEPSKPRMAATTAQAAYKAMYGHLIDCDPDFAQWVVSEHAPNDRELMIQWCETIAKRWIGLGASLEGLNEPHSTRKPLPTKRPARR